ncbi:hypothetical protein [Pectinatus sottacetonis]|uniref:hypothetical protein n=1 Tax=Pectinatus sottacetonis TaxID=1002795 RepID=UPI0018C83DFF|nr:hypothetical protein [Pectinatus sottacetonis]
MRKITDTISIMAAMFLALGILMPLSVRAAPAEKIAIVDIQQVTASYPGIDAILQKLENMRKAAQNDYNQRSKGMAADKRRELSISIGREESAKEDVLLKPVREKIQKAVKAAAADAGVAVVLEAAVTTYSSTDITAAVIQKVKQ